MRVELGVGGGELGLQGGFFLWGLGGGKAGVQGEHLVGQLDNQGAEALAESGLPGFPKLRIAPCFSQ